MKKPYKKMPTIRFGDYQLRTIKKSDAKDMFEYGRDRDVTKYLNWGPFVLESEALDSIKHIFLPRLREQLPIGYAIIDTKKTKMIGTIDFHSKIKSEKGAEIGYVIHKDYWNKGIMSDALKQVIKVGFEYLDYQVIRIKHLKTNVASQKVIEKAGFKFVKSESYFLEKRTAIIKDQLLIYELYKEDYYGNK
ncbi:MAG: GNAT family N-acetyltransferase [Acholeplasmataceae bacterium]|nr:GNAT family N-acetyltransferase [Acholeplasmataceae bacterium]